MLPRHFPNIKNKTVFVPWSGGVDSTSLIKILLENGNRVIAGYIRLENNETKIPRELGAIGKLRVYFEEKYPNGQFHYDGEIASLRMTWGSVLLKQIPPFITAIATYVDSEIDCVCMGYVSGDSAVSFLKDIEKIYYSFNGLTGSPLPKILFPLIKNTR